MVKPLPRRFFFLIKISMLASLERRELLVWRTVVAVRQYFLHFYLHSFNIPGCVLILRWLCEVGSDPLMVFLVVRLLVKRA